MIAENLPSFLNEKEKLAQCIMKETLLGNFPVTSDFFQMESFTILFATHYLQSPLFHYT